MLREMAVKEPAARSAKPEQFVDMTFVKELDGSDSLIGCTNPLP